MKLAAGVTGDSSRPLGRPDTLNSRVPLKRRVSKRSRSWWHSPNAASSRQVYFITRSKKKEDREEVTGHTESVTVLLIRTAGGWRCCWGCSCVCLDLRGNQIFFSAEGGERKVEGQRTLLPRGRGRTWKDGLDQGWQEESRGCRRPPCRRGDGQLTPLLGSVFTCGSPGCWGGRGTSALFQCLTSHLAETGRVTSHTLSLQIHWYMEEVSALTAALDNDSAFVIVSHGGYHKY